MKLSKRINCIDNMRFYFEHKNADKAAYIREDYSYSSDWTVESHDCVFVCPICDKVTSIEDLIIEDNIVTCECGYETHINDIRHNMRKPNYYENMKCDMTLHNINNGTYMKFDVPTILGTTAFYCNKCHKTHNLNEYDREDGKLICECGAKYTFEECKISYGGEDWEPIASNIYFNDNKISISILESVTDVNRHGNYYWSTGNIRITMNLDTGYTYLTNKGCSYNNFNKLWKKYQGDNSNAPKMFNATYMIEWNQIHSFIDAQVKNLINKYSNQPSTIRFIFKHQDKLKAKLRKKLIKQVDNYMTQYYNKKFNYKVKSIQELIDECKYNKVETYDAIRLFVMHNRFINANLTDIEYNIPMILSNLKFNNRKDIFKKMYRETNTPLIDVTNAFVKVSKSLKKQIIKQFCNNKTKIHWDDSFFMFLYVASKFEKKENVNKLYKTIVGKMRSIYYEIPMGLDLWKNFRTEEYIANLELEELRKKAFDMRDSVYTIERIKSVYGEDWDYNVIKFHNEKQFHDDLVTITNSKIFKELQDEKRRIELSEPFKMEDEVFKLADNNISIALSEYELTVIGTEMHICVGSYGYSVKNRNCRIAYIKQDDEYKACLELKMINNKNKKEYELHQAKLKYNSLVGSNKEIYDIVKAWCKKNKITIVTNDMKPRYELPEKEQINIF